VVMNSGLPGDPEYIIMRGRPREGL
jgi:hypothetical protein